MPGVDDPLRARTASSATRRRSLPRRRDRHHRRRPAPDVGRAGLSRSRRPRQWLTSGGLGTMGFGLPAAIGAALARPERTVVCFSGDGSLLMNMQELATAAEEGVNVKVILLNNAPPRPRAPAAAALLRRPLPRLALPRRARLRGDRARLRHRGLGSRRRGRSPRAHARATRSPTPGPCLVNVPIARRGERLPDGAARRRQPRHDRRRAPCRADQPDVVPAPARAQPSRGDVARVRALRAPRLQRRRHRLPAVGDGTRERDPAPGARRRAPRADRRASSRSSRTSSTSSAPNEARDVFGAVERHCSSRESGRRIVDRPLPRRPLRQLAADERARPDRYRRRCRSPRRAVDRDRSRRRRGACRCRHRRAVDRHRDRRRGRRRRLPPFSRSASSAPTTVSLPASPRSVSAPGPPTSVSLPRAPTSASSPSSPQRRSSPVAPARRSPPSPPRMTSRARRCRRSRRRRRCPDRAGRVAPFTVQPTLGTAPSHGSRRQKKLFASTVSKSAKTMGGRP